MDGGFFVHKSWHDVTPNIRRRILSAVVRDVLVLLSLACVGEVGLRVLWPNSSRHLFTRSLTGGHLLALNSLGFRDREFSRSRPEGQLRILCLGNSTTYGAGVAREATYPKQLQGLLQKRLPHRSVFVINAGGEGRSTVQALEFLRQDGLEMEPSIVILGFSPSMLGVILRERNSLVSSGLSQRPTTTNLIQTLIHEVRGFHLFLRASRIYSVLDANMRYALYRCDLLRAATTRPAGAVFSYAFDVEGVFIDRVEATFALFAEALGELQDVLTEQRVPFIVLGFPSRFTLSDEPVDNLQRIPVEKIRIRPIERVAEYCGERGVPFVNARIRLSQERRRMLAGDIPWDELYIPLDYTHLNPRGHQIVAEALLAELESRGLIDDETAVP